MEKTTKKELLLVGIEIRTTNQNNRAANDIPNLWKKFMEKGFEHKIKNKLNNTLYAVYTDYEGDHNKPYSVLLGYEVTCLDNIASNLTVRVIPETNYLKFTAQGNLMENAVINTWNTIWDSDIERAYTFDLEVYDERALNPLDGEADILVSV